MNNKVKFIKKLKGGSLSSTSVVMMPGGEYRVRKSVSRKSEREHGLVRWHSQIRRMQQIHKYLPDNSPIIKEIGVENDTFYYDIPFYEKSVNIFEYLSKEGSDKGIELFEQVNELIKEYSSISFGRVKGSFSVFLAEEVNERLFNVTDALQKAHNQGSITKEESKFINSKIPSTLKLINTAILKYGYIGINESLTHGNLTLENMLYSEYDKNIILIDPYSETYCESVLGDYSQLMQSTVSSYESVVLLGENGIVNLNSNPPLICNEGVESFGRTLMKNLSNLEPEHLFILNLFHAAQFIRMFPFKIGKTPRLALHFLLHGISIIEETFSNS
ncbi:hypothetical protein OAG73_00770 [bacterium]|nr:hypothetical protein [bacterium]